MFLTKQLFHQKCETKLKIKFKRKMDTKYQTVIILSSLMSGISFSYWLQAVICNTEETTMYNVRVTVDKFLGFNNDILTFAACLITSVLAISSIVLILKKESHRMFGKISLGLAVILCCLWVGSLVDYCMREYQPLFHPPNI